MLKTPLTQWSRSRRVRLHVGWASRYRWAATIPDIPVEHFNIFATIFPNRMGNLTCSHYHDFKAGVCRWFVHGSVTQESQQGTYSKQERYERWGCMMISRWVFLAWWDWCSTGIVAPFSAYHCMLTKNYPPLHFRVFASPALLWSV